MKAKYRCYMKAAIPFVLIIMALMTSGCLEGDIIRSSGNNYYNYTNTTGGSGGVSFNGSAVDMNKSHFYNANSIDMNNTNITNISYLTLQANATKKLNLVYYPNGSFYMVEI